jgi:hypothetical protein
MRIRNETHEPLLVRVDDEVYELEPGDVGIARDEAKEIIIEHSPKPHVVVDMSINGN